MRDPLGARALEGQSLSDTVVRTPRVPSRVPIPLLIKCGWVFMVIWAVTIYVTAAVVLVGAAIDVIVNGVGPMRGTEGDFLTVFVFVVFAASSGPFAWGVWTERPWTREVAMAFWVGLSLAQAAGIVLEPHSDDARALLYLLSGGAIAVWYFYRKRNVVLYYDELEARGRSA